MTAAPYLPVDWLQITLGDPPDLDGIRSDVIERPTGVPYLERFHLLESRKQSIRFHRFLADDPADPHDHPYDSWSLVICGRIIEYTAHEKRYLRAGDLIYRPAEREHRLELETREAWTYYVAGPVRRRWGFHTAEGWRHWTDYLDAGIYRTDDDIERAARERWPELMAARDESQLTESHDK